MVDFSSFSDLGATLGAMGGMVKGDPRGAIALQERAERKAKLETDKSRLFFDMVTTAGPFLSKITDPKKRAEAVVKMNMMLQPLLGQEINIEDFIPEAEAPTLSEYLNIHPKARAALGAGFRGMSPEQINQRRNSAQFSEQARQLSIGFTREELPGLWQQFSSQPVQITDPESGTARNIQKGAIWDNLPGEEKTTVTLARAKVFQPWHLADIEADEALARQVGVTRSATLAKQAEERKAATLDKAIGTFNEIMKLPTATPDVALRTVITDAPEHEAALRAILGDYKTRKDWNSAIRKEEVEGRIDMVADAEAALKEKYGAEWETMPSPRKSQLLAQAIGAKTQINIEGAAFTPAVTADLQRGVHGAENLRAAIENAREQLARISDTSVGPLREFISTVAAGTATAKALLPLEKIIPRGALDAVAKAGVEAQTAATALGEVMVSLRAGLDRNPGDRTLKKEYEQLNAMLQGPGWGTSKAALAEAFDRIEQIIDRTELADRRRLERGAVEGQGPAPKAGKPRSLTVIVPGVGTIEQQVR